MPKLMKGILIAVAVCVVLFVLCGVGLNLAFRAISYSFYKTAQPYGDVDESISTLQLGEEGELSGYLYSPKAGEPLPTVLYFGGSGEIALNAVQDRHTLFEGYNFASVDYAGSQQSAGKMNLASMQYSATSLYDALAAREDVDTGRIYIVGYSFGTGMATYLAAQRPCAGLVLLAPYSDTIELYNCILPVFHSPLGWFVRDNITAGLYAKAVNAPSLVVSSAADTTIPTSLSLAMAKGLADVEVLQVENTLHESYWEDESVVSSVQAFLQ